MYTIRAHTGYQTRRSWRGEDTAGTSAPTQIVLIGDKRASGPVNLNQRGNRYTSMKRGSALSLRVALPYLGDLQSIRYVKEDIIACARIKNMTCAETQIECSQKLQCKLACFNFAEAWNRFVQNHFFGMQCLQVGLFDCGTHLLWFWWIDAAPMAGGAILLRILSNVPHKLFSNKWLFDTGVVQIQRVTRFCN